MKKFYYQNNAQNYAFEILLRSFYILLPVWTGTPEAHLFLPNSTCTGKVTGTGSFRSSRPRESWRITDVLMEANDFPTHCVRRSVLQGILSTAILRPQVGIKLQEQLNMPKILILHCLVKRMKPAESKTAVLGLIHILEVVHLHIDQEILMFTGTPGRFGQLFRLTARWCWRGHRRKFIAFYQLESTSTLFEVEDVSASRRHFEPS